MAIEIIPFGRYKGQPIEVLAGDPKYADWLRQQDWFRNRFGSLYQIVINNFAEPSETPEHNRLQARLLDRDFCIRLAAVVEPKALELARKKATDWRLEKLQYLEKRNYSSSVSKLDKLKAEIDRLRVDPHAPPSDCTLARIEFEVAGWDAVALLHFHLPEVAEDEFDACFAVEAKPALGDDYPAVLRQIKHHRSLDSSSTWASDRSVWWNRRGSGSGFRAVLLVDQLTVTGATKEQIAAIFQASGISLVMLAQVEAIDRPPLLPA